MTSIEDNPVLTKTQLPHPRRKRPLRLILSILLIIVIIIIGSAVAYAKFDMFKSPKTLYLQAEKNSLTSTTGSFSFLKEKLEKEVKPRLDKPGHYSVDISNLSIESAQEDEQLRTILDLIKRTTLGFDIQHDGKNSTTLGKLNLNIDNKPLLNIETAFDKEQFAVRIPEIYAKYGYVNFKDWGSLKEDFNLNKFPKKIVTYKDILNAVSINQKEMSAVIMPYAKLYADSIDPEQVTLKKDAEMVEGSTPISAREITVTLTQSDITNLTTGIINKMQEDTTLQDLIYTRITNVIKLFNDSGYQAAEISKAEFLKNWKQWTDEARKSLEKNSLTDGATMVLYIDGNHRILERKLSLQVKSEDGKNHSVQVKIANWADDSFLHNSLFFMSAKDEADKGGELKILNASNVNDKGGKGTLSFNLKSNADTENTSFEATMNYDLLKSKAKDSGTYSFNLTVPGNDQNSGSIKGTITTTTAKTDDSSESNYDVNINFQDVSNETAVNGIKFKIHTKQEPIKEVLFPDITADNAFDLVNMTDDERAQLLEELSIGFQAFIEKNNELLQSFDVPF